jgi:hypothetical protein
MNERILSRSSFVVSHFKPAVLPRPNSLHPQDRFHFFLTPVLFSLQFGSLPLSMGISISSKENDDQSVKVIMLETNSIGCLRAIKVGRKDFENWKW